MIDTNRRLEPPEDQSGAKTILDVRVKTLTYLAMSPGGQG